MGQGLFGGRSSSIWTVKNRIRAPIEPDFAEFYALESDDDDSDDGG